MSTPPVFTLLEGIFRNQDSLGRPIVKTGTGRTQLQNFEAVANFLGEFMLPSWVPGGSRANSIARTMMAVSSSSPEPVKWKEFLQLGLRSPIGAVGELFGHDSVRRENIMGSDGRIPQTHAQVTREGVQNWLGMFGASAVGGATASVPGLARREERQQRQTNKSQLASQIASIRGDDSLSIAEKNRRIARLHARYRESLQ